MKAYFFDKEQLIRLAMHFGGGSFYIDDAQARKMMESRVDNVIEELDKRSSFLVTEATLSSINESCRFIPIDKIIGFKAGEENKIGGVFVRE